MEIRDWFAGHGKWNNDDSMYALKVFNENLCDTAGSKYYQSIMKDYKK